MLNLAGEQGKTLANEGVEAVRKVIEDTKAPPGVQAYVAGPAALTNDLHVIGNASLAEITLITLIAIAGMLLVVYRSIVTTLIQLFLTFIGLLTARGVVAVLANSDAFGLTTFAGNILTMLAIAAATDYGIFIFGRYREARGMARIGIPPTTRPLNPSLPSSWARPDDRRGHVLPQFRPAAYFATMGAPVAIGMVVVVASAVTLGPAILSSAAMSGCSNPNDLQGPVLATGRQAVVRWPGPVLVASAVRGADRLGGHSWV